MNVKNNENRMRCAVKIKIYKIKSRYIIFNKIRLDTKLTKSRADGQGPYLRSLDHLRRSSEVKKIKSLKK